ncbi:GNAT family N-acetyltransferase [Vallitalea okinawensis]|uniref:GNAT family N-acetyltransferase n=1 Tax=Vallitalea okinawensis TaxID=2078660 RepID=UPI000CFBD1CE|nr:GNAT family N-acetyltransferase [Vallitalea okinawensis]
METIVINEKTYKFVSHFKDNNELRVSFNGLAKKTYGFDFEEWYQNGYWQDRYIPYALLDGDKVISNVSVNVIDFIVRGENKTYVQIGTVMTDDDYRKQGLNRFLMEKVLEEWKGNCDLIYLFANDSVIDFYPKFGFVQATEYQYTKKVSSQNSTYPTRRLNMSDIADRNVLINMINDSLPFSQITMQDNASLIMFYCTSFMDEDVYYIQEFDAIVIADYDDDVLYLNDVFCKTEVPLDDIISAMVKRDIKRIVLGFTPNDVTSFDVSLLQEDDTTLFVMNADKEVLKNNKVMFPVLSHA